MNQPSPWILLIGGGALLNVAVMVGGTQAPAWARYVGMAICAALGLTCIGLALVRYFGKKPERAKYQSRRPARVELLPEVAARTGRNADGVRQAASKPSPTGREATGGEPPPSP